MIPFHKKNFFEKEIHHLNEFYAGKLSEPRQRIVSFFEEQFNHQHFFLTKSCTQSLELILMSLNIPEGKEVIIPSYGFVAIANAVAINRLKCIYVDCEPDTMNVSIPAILNAVTENTAAIITINYAGVACDYDLLKPFCETKGIYLIEDNAHGIAAKYKGGDLGTFGDVSAISFDFLKNISCNEGGGVNINKENLLSSFVKSYHFGTNKLDFLEGNVSSYEWKCKGTNSILAEHLSVILWTQLYDFENITREYLSKWDFYYKELSFLESKGCIHLPKIPDYSQHNGHTFWFKLETPEIRSQLIKFLKDKGIEVNFHYKPLHTSEYGEKVGVFRGEDRFTTKESGRLLRLPLYYSLCKEEQIEVIEQIEIFFR